jgi:hypothetical protein
MEMLLYSVLFQQVAVAAEVMETPWVPLVALVAVAQEQVQELMLVVLEILHQPPHHKEILVVLAQTLAQIMVLAVAVALALLVQMALALLVVLVAQEPHQVLQALL